MRIALLLNGASRARSDGSLDAARLVRLPPSARLSHALGSCLGADARHGSGVFVLAPVGAGVMDADAWFRIERRVPELNDDVAIDSELSRARRLLDEGKVDAAGEAYARCDALLAEDVGARRVEVLSRLAEIAERRGAARDAMRWLDQALALAPADRESIERRIALARAADDMLTAAALGARLLPLTPSDADRATLHKQIADDCLQAASAAMRAALVIDAHDRTLLERLRAVLEASERHEESVDAAVALAEELRDPASRARAFAAAAEKCARKAGNVERAVALYEAAIVDDPEVPGAFEAIEAVLLGSDDHAGAERAYLRQLARVAGRPGSQAVLLDKLARLREDVLGDRVGAIGALVDLVLLRPDDIGARAKLAALLEANGEDARAVRVLEGMAAQAPARAATFEMLHRVFTRGGDADRAYAASSVLRMLGEAGDEARATYRQGAPGYPTAAVQPLDDAAWELLQPPGFDEELTAIVQAIAPAAASIRIDELRAKKLLPRFGQRHEPASSPLPAISAVAWIARLLAMDPPEVFVHAEEVPGGVAVVPSDVTAIALGPAVLAGGAPHALTFLIARELAALRLTGRVLSLYPGAPELRHLVNAGIALAMVTRDLAPDVAATRAQLAGKMTVAERRALSAAVARLELRGGRFDLFGWVTEIDRTACRAALLAAGDVTVVARALATDDRARAIDPSGTSRADRMRDLVPFFVSQRYSGLRSATGLAVRSAR
jgi:tetratricopeptide (TPR) repeat protein